MNGEIEWLLPAALPPPALKHALPADSAGAW